MADEERPRLVMTGPAERAGETFELAVGETMIGRGETCDIVLDDDLVSRTHALITVDEAGTATVHDLHSTAGTSVNGQPIEGPYRLSPGDELGFADIRACYEGPTTPTTPPPPANPTSLTNPSSPERALLYTVTGTVASPASASVGGLQLALVDTNVGGDVALTTGRTKADGSFTLDVRLTPAQLAERHKTAPDLQVHASSNGAVLASSDVRYGATDTERLDVELPADALLQSEYESLTGALSALYTGSLAELEESDARQDITYLANKSGWDARAVAMASQAATLSAAAANGTPAPATAEHTLSNPAYYYALLRAGLSTDPAALDRTDPAAVQATWTAAANQGVIPPSLLDGIDKVTSQFIDTAARTALSTASPTGGSALSDMLQVTLGTDATRQQQFADLLVRYQSEPDQLWTQTEKLFGADVSAQLQLAGQIAYLTSDNAPLMQALYQTQHQQPLSTLSDLASAGYWQASAWEPLMANVTPPAGTAGSTPDEQRANYAAQLAAQVRLSYPTTSVAAMAADGALGIAVKGSGAGAFLAAHPDLDIGGEPIANYLTRTSTTADAPTTAQITRIQRVYQLTSDTTAMGALLGANLDSAYAITRTRRDAFVQTHGDALGGTEIAEAVYGRAQSVNAATTHLALTYLSAAKQPNVGTGAMQTIVGGGIVRHPIGNGNAPTVAAQATLDELFGDLDYCQCDDCQSITSPAAYLVDLLDWLGAASPAAGKANPRDALLARRPDIGALPLTCANTNTALPYLDLVNETLEYYVGNAAPETLTAFTGYSDDGRVSSAELLASPQNDDNAVAQNAYALLEAQWFPPPLPLYRDLELLRQHISRFRVGLYDVMLALRIGESLETPNPADPHAYGWRDILAERLGLSRLEYRLLTDSTLTLAQLYGYPTGTASTGAGGVLASIAPLQEFSRRTGLAYSDIVSLLQTRFVNPGSWLIELLQGISLPFATLQALNAGTLSEADFNTQLPAGLDSTDYGTGGVAAWVNANFATIADLIVIDVAANPCDTEGMTLQYLNGSPLTELDGYRLMRFIRLWRKLGLTIQQTDDLISALYESTAPSTATAVQQLDSGFLTLLPRIGIAYQAIDLLGLDPTTDMESLLACWAPIGTGGQHSLYAQMFLNPTVLLDPVFSPDVHGDLFTGAPTLLAHEPAICAALNLTRGEFALITGPAPLGLGWDGTTPLTLDAISAIFRRAWLARTLQLSVLELLHLIVDTAVDPFALPVLDATHAVSAPLLDFVRRAQALTAANLTPVQALYLLFNDDLSGVSAPSHDVVNGLAIALRGACLAIDSQFSVSGSVTAATAQALMSLVLGAGAAGVFFGLIENTFSTSVPFGDTQPTLPASVTAAADGRLTYDDLGKALSFAGYFDATTLAALQAAAGADAALTGALTALAAANAQAVQSFFATYDDPHAPWLKPLFDTYVAAAHTNPATALTALLNGLLPVLGNLRKREQALSCAATAAGCAPSFPPALLQNPASIPAANPASAGSPGVSDLTALGTGGLSVSFFLTDNPGLAPDQTHAVAPSLSYGPGHPLPAPTGGATSIAARWSGFISAPQDGDYNLSFAVDAGAAVTAVTVGGRAVALDQVGNVWSNATAIALQAGALVAIEITATGLTTTFGASWETLGSGWAPIPADVLYSDVLLGYLTTTTLRFLKATALAEDLSLNADEIAYLALAPELAVGGTGWLAGLAVDAPAPPAWAAPLTAVLDALTAFAALKARYSPLAGQTPQLLRILQDIASGADTAGSELLALTGWDGASLGPLLARLFSGAAGLAVIGAQPGLLAKLLRLQQAYALVSTCQLSAATLIDAATNDPTPTPASTVLADFQSAVRSRYAESDWLMVVQPINNAIRELQRDALVAYILATSGPAILATLGIAATPNRLPTADDLFNYFLLDVEMEPCMETSRIRMALSAVQLFIERCLRNLEPTVDPGSVDPHGEWEWRKRYRVWQANREVFLWPENWLEPSLRDDQSPFFQTIMTKLLQSDITDDAAVSAYLDYLSNLEDVAKLDPCGIWYQPAPAGSTDDLAHVIARTAGARRKHYYRRREGGSWTPWQEIKLTIEDNPVVPFVWDGRLLLLWLQVHHHSATTAATLGSQLPTGGSDTLGNSHLSDLSHAAGAAAPGLATEQVSVALHFSEYYNGAWQPVKTSDVSNPVVLGTFAQGTFDRRQLHLAPWISSDLNDGSLYVQVQYGDPQSPIPPWNLLGPVQVCGFALHNTHSEPVAWMDNPAPTIAWAEHLRMLNHDAAPGRSLTAAYWTVSPTFVEDANLTVVTGQLPQTLVQPQGGVPDQTVMPFFFRDARSSFYVMPSLAWTWIRFRGYGTGWGSVVSAGTGGFKIPTIVVGGLPALPSAGPVQQPGDTTIASAVGQTALAQDGFRAVLAGGTTFAFQGRAVGVAGSAPISEPPAAPAQ